MTDVRPQALADRLRPGGADLVDITASAVLAALATVGFRHAFGGNDYLIVAVCGSAVGALVGYAVVRLRFPPLVAAAVAIAAFFVLGGAVALRDQALAGALPTPAVFSGLVDGAIYGWARLITSVAPAGSSGNLLAVPYLCAFGSAFLSVLLALLVRRWPLCVLPAVAALALGILFGTDEPSALVLQGAVFAALAIGWMSVREARAREVVAQTSHRRHRAGGVALLATAALGGVVLGPILPLAHANARYVLRDRVQPPFDPREFASPLVSFRRYLDKDHAGEVQLTGKGLPAATPVRLAVLDDYDGVVWSVSPGSVRSAGAFERVGPRLPSVATGPRARATFRVGALESVWVPVAGAVGGVSFQGPRRTALTDSFRFNRASGVGAVPMSLRSGDRYQLDLAVPAPPADAALSRLSLDENLVRPPPPGVPASIKGIAAERIAGKSTDLERVKALESWFKDGYYSDGGPDATPSVPPGHSLARLVDFLGTGKEKPVGDGEQYAAGMALLARSLGMPVRVVMGFRPGPSATPAAVTGDQVDAWVEVAFRGAGWVAFHPTPSRDNKPPVNPPPVVTPPVVAQTPPPSVPPPPNTVPPRDPSDTGKPPPPPSSKKGFVVPGWVFVGAASVGLPLLAVLGCGGVIVGLKSQRRRRRRERGTPAAQIAGGWHEVLDLARDLGKAVPPKATRREAARFLQIDGTTRLAADADAAVFGHQEPTPDVANEFWDRVLHARQGAMTSMRRRDRLRSATALSSLRGGR